MVTGHRRHRASHLAEKETMPVIVRDLTMTSPPSSWLTATCSEKNSSPVKGLLPTR
ncbi:ParB N-terminal domain-containing protein [Peptoniphilus vaginalis]|uniref:ParB N-terminal domain-containing protein n=1 Tax=Peptoniphilus vaginalis TaxID=1756987 RepID=UPI003CC8A473